ncbi:hypothetical protein [Burkholderia seminalis]|uniref:hypothetical protein n=1 Tax=Burkholderia seminalis TaxID=488731 RepID=UPI0015818494|nr:hypothetical protein [Burkholderia seminalis]MCA8432418.1 hypothetical protein [Burkholderia seminalis]
MSISVGMEGLGVSVRQTGIVDERIIYRNLTICLKPLLPMGLMSTDKKDRTSEKGAEMCKKDRTSYFTM